MSKREFSEAESLLLYWKGELDDGHGHNNYFKILNELVGHYRKVADMTKGIAAVNDLINFINEHSIANDISGATGYINIATALSSFKRFQESYNFFQKAKDIFTKNYDVNKLIAKNENHINDELIMKFASLYNNMATTLFGFGDLDTSLYYDNKALELNKYILNGDLNSAVTNLNMANTLEKKDGIEKADKTINELMKSTIEILENHKNDTDSHYVYIMQKCVPTLEYYGFFFYANVFRKRINEINNQ